MTAFPPPVSWLADTSLRVSLVIALLILLRPWLRNRLGNGVAPWLWLIVAARLLAPWPMPMLWSVLPDFAASTMSSVASGPEARVTLGAPNEHRHGATLSASAAVNAQRDEPAALPLFLRANGWNLLWLTGVVACLANLLRAWRQIRRWAPMATPKDNDSRLQTAFDSIPPALRKGITLRVTSALDVPTLFGVWHPQIWMPQECLDRLETPELRHILLHELGHARRRDLLAQWGWSLACSLHWFNPLVWLAARLAQADRELACDAWVLAHEGSGADDDFAAEYGRTLIRVVEHLRHSPIAVSPAAVAMAAGKHNLGLRVREIRRFRPAEPGWGLAAAAVTLAGVALLTAGHTAPVPDSSAAPTPPSSPAPPAAAPLPRPAPTAAPDPTAAAAAVHPSNKQLEFESKMVALSKTVVAQLKDQKAQFPGAEALIDQLTGAFAPKDASGAAAAPMPYSVCQIVSDAVTQKFLRGLLQTKGVDLISAPRVTTKPDQKATVEIIREFLYPTKFERSNPAGLDPILTPQKFEKKNTGLTLAVEGGLSPAEDAVDLNIDWQVADVQGYVGKDGKPVAAQDAMGTASRPVFSTQEIATCVTMAPYSTLVLGSLRYNPATWQTLYAHKTIEEDAIVLIFVTVKLVNPDIHSNADLKREENTEALQHKLWSIVLPTVEFKDMALPDAIEFVRQEAAKADPEPDSGKRGVNIFLKLPATGATAARVTFSAQNVPVLKVLQTLAAQAGLKVKVEEYAASLVPLTEVTEKLVTVQKQVPSELAKAFSPPVADGSAVPARVDPRPWLQTRGITFPPGSSATYLPKMSKLVVRNTQENVDRLDIALAAP